MSGSLSVGVPGSPRDGRAPAIRRTVWIPGRASTTCCTPAIRPSCTHATWSPLLSPTAQAGANTIVASFVVLGLLAQIVSIGSLLL